MTQTDDLVEQQWGRRTFVHRGFLPDDRAKEAVVRSEVANLLADALAEGHRVTDPHPKVMWTGIDPVDVEVLCRVDRTLPEWRDADDAVIAAEEDRARAWYRECRELRVSVRVLAPPEKPGLVQLDRQTHAELVGQGVEVLSDKDRSVLVCGGAMRRHSFPPRDAAWLRDGAIDKATCQDCRQTVTRDELLQRAANEEAYGTCVTCGDALNVPDDATGVNRYLLSYCPTCRASGRE